MATRNIVKRTVSVSLDVIFDANDPKGSVVSEVSDEFLGLVIVNAMHQENVFHLINKGAQYMVVLASPIPEGASA